MLRAHTFLSCFERVSFNFALISICCFWDSFAGHSSRRNKLPIGISYKRPFQPRPLFCLYASVSITASRGIKASNSGAHVTQTLLQLHIIHSSQGGFIAEQSKWWTMLASSHNKEILSIDVRNGSMLLWGNRLTRYTAGAILTALTATPLHHSSPLELTHQKDGIL